MRPFIPGGPARYAHQVKGLRKLIETGGIAALLFDPGTGKTATTLDYLSILALKADPDATGAREIRVLVAAPLAAVDTWVIQATEFMSPQVSYWAEALGGSLIERAEALAARGGKPMRLTLTRIAGSKRLRSDPPRAAHWRKSLAWAASSRDEPGQREIAHRDGPDALGAVLPRVVLLSLNLDTFSSRRRYRSGTMADLILDGIRRFDPHVVIVDESHKIKGNGSNVSRLMDRVGQTVKRRILLTGTVMPLGPLDVFAQWRFLDPHAFGQLQPDGTRKRATWLQFRDRYAIMGGYMGREVKGYKNLDELQDIMAERAIVVRKQDALDLPPVTPVIVPVNLSTTEQTAYDDMKRQLSVQLATGQLDVGNRLEQLLRLRQITSGHLPDNLGVVQTIGSSKVNTIASIVKDTLAGERRIAVFVFFTHELHALADALADSRTEVLVVGGETSKQERIAHRMRFGSDDPQRIVMIAQVKTMSLAVNELITASNAVFGSLSQQRDDLIQAIDRLHRIGQTLPVTVWFALAPGTVDEVIYDSHRNRTDLESAILKHIEGGVTT